MKSDDLISRQEAIEALGEEPEVWTNSECEIASRSQWLVDVDAIKAVPSAERKTGKWIEHKRAEETHDALISNYECSECHDWLREAYTFCPTCGADMRGKK